MSYTKLKKGGGGTRGSQHFPNRYIPRGPCLLKGRGGRVLAEGLGLRTPYETKTREKRSQTNGSSQVTEKFLKKKRKRSMGDHTGHVAGRGSRLV